MNRRDFLARLIMQAAAAAPVTYSFIGSGIWMPPKKVLGVANVYDEMGSWTLENVIRHGVDVGRGWAEITFVKT